MNKHIKLTQVEVERDAGDYVGKHRLFSSKSHHQVWMGCYTCLADLRS